MVKINDLVEIVLSPNGEFFSPVLEGERDVDKALYPLTPKYVDFDFVDFDHSRGRKIPERANAYLDIKPKGTVNPDIARMLAEGYKIINYFRIDNEIVGKIKTWDEER